jgi:hypothetical protein
MKMNVGKECVPLFAQGKATGMKSIRFILIFDQIREGRFDSLPVF